MKNNRKIALGVLIVAALGQCSYSWADDPTDEVVKEAVKAGLGAIGEKVMEAYPYVGLARQINKIVGQIRAHNFPTKEEEALAEEIAHEYGFLAAESGFEKCLIQNQDARVERMNFGVPVACREIMDAFISYGGKKEVDRIIVIYNEVRD